MPVSTAPVSLTMLTMQPTPPPATTHSVPGVDNRSPTDRQDAAELFLAVAFLVGLAAGLALGAPVGSAIGQRHTRAHSGATNKCSADMRPTSLFSDCDTICWTEPSESTTAALAISTGTASSTRSSHSTSANISNTNDINTDAPLGNSDSVYNNTSIIMPSSTSMCSFIVEKDADTQSNTANCIANILLGDNTATNPVVLRSISSIETNAANTGCVSNTIGTIGAKTQLSMSISSIEGSTDTLPSTNINKAITAALHSNASDNCTVDASFGDTISISTSSIEKDDASTTSTSTSDINAGSPRSIDANETNKDSASNSRSEMDATNPAGLHTDSGIEQLAAPSDSDIEAWERRWDITAPLFYDIEWRTSDLKARWQECHRSYSEPATPAEAHYDREWAKEHSKLPAAMVKRHSRSHSLNSLVNDLAEVDDILI